MQYQLNTSLWCSLSETGFSLDELLLKLQDLFSSKGFPGILQLILDLVQEALIADSVFSQKRTWCDCLEAEYVLNAKTAAMNVSL